MLLSLLFKELKKKAEETCKILDHVVPLGHNDLTAVMSGVFLEGQMQRPEQLFWKATHPTSELHE